MITNGKYRHRVIVVGAGFGGLAVARALRGARVEALIIDRNNYHTFQPLLYQVASAGLEPEEIAYAVRDIFQGQEHINFRLGTVTGVNAGEKRVLLEDSTEIPYDFLVLAAGAANHFFGIEGVERHAFKLKTLTDAIRLRSHIVRQFELADQEPSRIDSGILNFVVVGGGPTGVELAGSLAELFDLVLRKDYPRFDVGRARVTLVEMQNGLLAMYDESLQDYTRRTLEKRRVNVLLGSSVVRATADAVHLKDGRIIPTRTLIWAAGVRVNPLADVLGFEQTRQGRIVVCDDLSVPGHPEVFVIGDMAAGRDEKGDLHPQLAPVAMQGARHAARMIRNRIEEKPTKRFVYVDKGTMATIGRHAAVAEIGRFNVRGFIAWVMWLVLHLIQLIGFRNRLNVLINWTWNYFTYDRSGRLIMEDAAHLERHLDASAK